MVQEVLANLAVSAIVVLAWSHILDLINERARILRAICFGMVMGSGAIASMSSALTLIPGVIFDFRSSLVVVAGFFGGWPAVLVAGTAVAFVPQQSARRRCGRNETTAGDRRRD